MAFVLSLFREHKFKMFSVLMFALFFMAIRFPYDDLSEVVSSMVAERTQNQVFIQFDHLGIQLIPNPALAIDNVSVETAMLPAIQASRLSLAPSISGFLSFRPGFNADASDVWGGDVDVEVQTGKANSDGIKSQLIQLDIENVDLSRIHEAVDLPLKVQGRISGKSQMTLDPSFLNQPEGNLDLSAKELRFPTGTIPTQMGPVMLPGMSWGEIDFRGRLSNGKLQIEQANLGKPTDLVNGSVKGEIDVRVINGGGQPALDMGAYQLTVDLNVSSRVEKELGLFLALLGNYKSQTATGSRFRFKIAGARFGLPPSISPTSL